MPFCNTAKYPRECIESVLQQSHRNFELILQDNASDDDSSEFAGRDPRVKCFPPTSLIPQVPNDHLTLGRI